MPSAITVPANAKVNLHLHVLGRRQDGFHEILSLFQIVSLADELDVRRVGPDGRTAILGEFGFPPEANIIDKTVRLFRAETGIDAGVEVTVNKRIPMAAGLGGGSSDAAGVLKCLDALFETSLTPERLHGLAVRLGSDVAFFLGSAAALVEGRGDRLTPLVPRVDYALAALMPGVPMMTREAFHMLDEGWEKLPREGHSREEVLRMYREEPPEAWVFSNTFDPVADARSPRFQAAREALLASGALAARLTGSGETVIGVFKDSAGAQAAVDHLSAAGQSATALLPHAAIPALCYNK
jgi:4-diphosphocytidyl-2-C-methyl-D-erythritol kinase